MKITTMFMGHFLLPGFVQSWDAAPGLPAQRAAAPSAAKCSPPPSVSPHTDLFLPAAAGVTLRAVQNKIKQHHIG